eukprot:scaffold8978_cov80-Phaeocystis_antarctica.AAC.1
MNCEGPLTCSHHTLTSVPLRTSHVAVAAEQLAAPLVPRFVLLYVSAPYCATIQFQIWVFVGPPQTWC